MIFFCALLVHVPKYDDGCDHNCCAFEHGPTTSQVAYLRGSGGIEYEIDVLGDYVDYNFVFRSAYDTSTFSMYAGCGHCHSTRPFNYDEPRSLPLASEAYANAKLEAFSPHSYYELLEKRTDENGDAHSPRFNTSALSDCEGGHFSIRLVVFDNATEEVVYGVVVGCDGGECERFTFLEMLSLPIYALRNHAFWNEAIWTLPLIALSVPLLMFFVLWWWHGGWLSVNVPTSISFPRQLARMQPNVEWKDLKYVQWNFSWRCVFYAIATYAIVVDLLETFAHFLIAARDVPAGSSGYFMFSILYALKISFLLAAILPWFWAREIPQSKWRDARCDCGSLENVTQLLAHGAWSLFDLAVAIAALLLGAGFFVFPAAAVAAACLRFSEWQCERAAKPPRLSQKQVTFAQQDTFLGYERLPSLTIF